MESNGKPAAERAKLLENIQVLVPQDAEGLARYPNLLDLLLPRYVAGTCTRQAGKLSLRVEGPSFKVGIDCPTEGVQTFIHVESLWKALECVEKALASGKCLWMPNYESAKKGRPKIDKSI
jgi:hypothetical protein